MEIGWTGASQEAYFLNNIHVTLWQADEEAPEGKESNWVQTVPGMGWHMLFRLYGPEQAWFDKTWRPSEIELVK